MLLQTPRVYAGPIKTLQFKHTSRTPWKVALHILYLLKTPPQTNSFFNFLIVSLLCFNWSTSCNKSPPMSLQLEGTRAWEGEAEQLRKLDFARLCEGVAAVRWIRSTHLSVSRWYCKSKCNIQSRYAAMGDVTKTRTAPKVMQYCTCIFFPPRIVAEPF